MRSTAANSTGISMLVEMLPERPFPLDMTTFTGAVERAVGGLLVELMGKNAPDPSSIHVEEDGVVAHFEPPSVHPSPGMLIHPFLVQRRKAKRESLKNTPMVDPRLLAALHPGGALIKE